MIVSDALRQDVVGCYGGVARTPNIDALAENGVMFENAYSTSPWTSPSAVGMFTGNYATSYGCAPEAKTKRHVPIQIYVPHNQFLFIEALQQLRYITGMKIENINASIHNNFQGFEEIPDFEPTKQTADSINTITDGGLYDSWLDSEAYKHSFDVLKYLLDIPPEENFFILHWILDPHFPYAPAQKFASSIYVDESKLPVPTHFYWTRRYDMSTRSAMELKFIRDLYVAEVESVDERVGFILKILKHKDLLDDTYFIFTSDHGEQFGQHGLFGHGGHGLGCHYYEGLIRIPLIIAGPELPKGKRIKNIVSLLGLMPTLKDLLGVEYKDDVQGRSYSPLILENSRFREPLYFDDVRVHDQIDALIENTYKLISLKGSRYELYDVFIDPEENSNFASRNTQLVESMHEKLMKYRERNQQRQKQNIALLDEDMDKLSDDEKQDVIEKLKALGYIK